MCGPILKDCFFVKCYLKWSFQFCCVLQLFPNLLICSVFKFVVAMCCCVLLLGDSIHVLVVAYLILQERIFRFIPGNCCNEIKLLKCCNYPIITSYTVDNEGSQITKSFHI